jgi:hypothetical protein
VEIFIIVNTPASPFGRTGGRQQTKKDKHEHEVGENDVWWCEHKNGIALFSQSPTRTHTHTRMHSHQRIRTRTPIRTRIVRSLSLDRTSSLCFPENPSCAAESNSFGNKQ